jgi:quercetin dioxygenase-like cupin family protein
MKEKMEKKNIKNPDEVRTCPSGKVELVTISGMTLGKITLEPGWKWSESVKPIVHTVSCMAPHTQYHLSGRLHVVMDDGTEDEFGPGDISTIPPGHDAWVVGNEPMVAIDVTGMREYAIETPITECAA